MTKIKTYATFIALGAVLFGFYLFDSTKNSDKDGDSSAAVKVAWSPVRRMEPLQIALLANGSAQANFQLNESPFFEPMHAPPGTLITVTAWQGFRESAQWHLECSITVKGKTTGPSKAVNNPDGSSTCVVSASA